MTEEEVDLFLSAIKAQTIALERLAIVVENNHRAIMNNHTSLLEIARFCRAALDRLCEPTYTHGNRTLQ